MNIFYIGVVLVALSIVAILAFYAGKLLFLLSQQRRSQEDIRKRRINEISESITIIIKALSQQQCDLSEGAIRICNLLDALPLIKKPDFRQLYPQIFGLFNDISGFPILDARKKLDKKTQRAQDNERHQIEANYELSVLKELPLIREFCEKLHH